MVAAALAISVEACSFPEVTYETTPEPSDAGSTCSELEDCGGAECGDGARADHGICADDCGNNPPCNNGCDQQLELDLEACVGQCTTCAEAMDCVSAGSRCSQLVGGP